MQQPSISRLARALAAVPVVIALVACQATAPSAPSASVGPTTPPAVQKITILYPAISPPHYPLWIAQEIGAFEKYGLD